MIPVSLEDQLAPGILEFAIHTLFEERMELSFFDEKYKNDETGRLAYDPKVLLKIILFGYSRGIISSRAIERVCRDNVTFMALRKYRTPEEIKRATMHQTNKAFERYFQIESEDISAIYCDAETNKKMTRKNARAERPNLLNLQE